MGEEFSEGSSTRIEVTDMKENLKHERSALSIGGRHVRYVHFLSQKHMAALEKASFMFTTSSQSVRSVNNTALILYGT